MKYKKHIATGALAFSLLISGSNVYANSPRDLGIKNVHQIYQRDLRSKKINPELKKHHAVGIVSVLNDTGFIINVKNLKAKTTSSVDVQISDATKYSKNGINAGRADLALGQKVIVLGNWDKTTNIITAKSVRIH